MSHFTKIKTKLYDLTILKRSLSDLQLEWTDEIQDVRGYKGQNQKAEIVIHQKNNYDLGFKWNGNEYGNFATTHSKYHYDSTESRIFIYFCSGLW